MFYMANISPRSTGKTTNTTWMCHALHERGRKVIGYDADDSRQFSRWHATTDYPFPVQQASSEAFHVTVPQLVPAGYEDGVGVVDVGHLEDHKAIGWSVLRVADLAVINVPPSMNDVERLDELPMKGFIQEVAMLRADSRPPATWVLLCKAPTGINETPQVRSYLRDEGYNVFSTVVPAVVKYMRTHEGAQVQAKGSVFDELVSEMEERGLLPKMAMTP
jgi:chromosome partitioning protein